MADAIPAEQVFGDKPIPAEQVFGQKPVPAEQVFSPSVSQQAASITKNLPDVVKKSAEAYQNFDVTPTPSSLVGKTMHVLSAPLRAEAGAMMQAAELVGVPGAKEFNDKFNPERKLFPEAYVSDISDFYIDRAAEKMGIPQVPGMLGDVVRGSLATGKFGVGLAANILADPLTGLKVGQLTKEAEAIQKMGGTLDNAKEVAKGAAPKINPKGLNVPQAQARNLIDYRVPLTKAGFSIEGKPVLDAAKAIGESPVVQKVASVIRKISPDTGNPMLDQAGRIHDNLRRGDPQDLKNRYALPKDALRMTADEDRIASALVESTPNLTPNLPKDILKAAERPERPFWQSEEELRRSMSLQIEDHAKRLGIDIAPGRETAITEAAIMAKKAAAENLTDKFHSGVLTKENIAEKTLENYLPHSMNPAYQGVKDAAEYEARLKSDEAKVTKIVTGTFMSSKDPTRYRTIRKSLDAANKEIKAAKGLDDYFITDPVKANVASLIKSKKLLRDSQYLDVAKDIGQRMSAWDAKRLGLDSVSHPELEGKTVVLKDPDGTTKTVMHKDLYYPKDIAEKIQSRVAPPALTGVRRMLQDYNRIFRRAIFMTSPGIKVGNTLDNILKTAAVTGKDFIQSHMDALSVLSGKSEGFRSDPTPARPKGTFYSGETLKLMLDKFGITQTNAWREGMGSVVDAGKDISLKEAMSRPGKLLPAYSMNLAKNLVKGVETFGEGGENTSRAALFLQRLKAGWEPEQAANEVTRYLFDYGRNSPTMENVRAFMPFIQHPAKTALLAPTLLGTAPGTYNFIQNAFPHVLANAFHDPVTQAQLNNVLPEHIKQRDAVYGPFIPGNTWMSTVFSANKDPKLGSMAWLDPRIGLRILNHFDYFSKGGSQRFVSELNPVLQGLVGFAFGPGDYQKSLDYANGNVNIANRASYLIGKSIEGLVPIPNTEKIIMQAFGAVDPKHVEPASVLIMKGLAGQFGGITDLDKDVQSKLLTLHYAYMDQKKQFVSAVKKELGESLSTNTLAQLVREKYRSVQGISPMDLFKQTSQVAADTQATVMSAQALGGKMSAGDFLARMRGISDEMHKVNLAYQVAGARKLQLMSGQH